MTLTQGSILQIMAAANGIVRCETRDDSWTLPLLGWAVVVSWRASETDEHERLPDEYETKVVPLILDDELGSAETIDRYIDDREGTTWRVDMLAPFTEIDPFTGQARHPTDPCMPAWLVRSAGHASRGHRTAAS